MKVPAILLAGALVALPTTFARATDLSAKINVDNDFGLYISTDDSVLGTPVMEYLSGNNWEITKTGSATLTPGAVNYIHVVAIDRGGGYAMFLGQFDLSDTDFSFANSTQSLLTGDLSWYVSKTGWGTDYASPTDEGPNGTAPWDMISGVDSSAHFIWADSVASGCACTPQTIYFSAPIFPNNGATPEPATLSLLVLGGIPLLLKRRRAN